MEKKKLIYNNNGKNVSKEIIVYNNVKALKPVLNETRLKILELLNEKSLYPSQIAEELKIHKQKIYYHIKLLKKAELIELVEEKGIRGATAKLYKTRYHAFGVELKNGKEEITDITVSSDSLKKFLQEFNKEGMFDGYIVVGSPEPHGPHKARARDGHYATHLAMTLGKYFNTTEFSVKLDTDIKAEKEMNKNLILIGGPITNIIMKDINEHLPVQFSDKEPWGLHSKRTGMDYTEENTGIIAKIKNPYDKEKVIIALAGIRNGGTKATVITLSNNPEMLKGKDYLIVQGYDYNGDGKIDSVEILE